MHQPLIHVEALNTGPPLLHIQLFILMSSSTSCACAQEPPATGAANSTAQHATTATNAAMRRRARSKAAGRGSQPPPRSGRDRTRQERYTEVEAYWRSLRPEQRQELLRVPLAALLQGQCKC
jgi:hypothetical protein